MHNTFSIKTLGCKLNQYESSLIARQFLDNGWESRPFGENVDIVIINTCTVTNKSDKKCRNYIRQGAVFSKTGKVLVTGCLADRDSDSIMDMPEVFAVFKNSEKEKIYFLIKNYNNKNFLEKLDIAAENIKLVKEKSYPLPFQRTRGLLKIQDGCDGKCSYCIVPTVRGLPVSRKFEDVLDHAHKLIDSGCPELILTGITIGKYASGNKSLPHLVREIIAIEGNFRVRITSIEPNHVTDDFISLFSMDKVCRHVHIPLQSGSDNVLRTMNRPYLRSDYISVIERIKKNDNNIAVGTDIIIGFPGETEEDFSLTLRAVKEAEFSYVHQFTFSPRTGTPASQMQECNAQEVSIRGERLRTLASKFGLDYRKKFIGRILPSIIEKNKTGKGFRAVSTNYIKIDIKNSLLNNNETGKITGVMLESVDSHGVSGRLAIGL